MKVLIADGSQAVTERLAALLLEIPTVELLSPTATSETTLQAIRTHDPEVLVIDAAVSGGQGRELIELVRKEKPAIVLIILSNRADSQHRKHYEAAGADLFMDKSHEFVHLVQFVRELARAVESGETSDLPAGSRSRLVRTKLKAGIPLGLLMSIVSCLVVGP